MILLATCSGIASLHKSLQEAHAFGLSVHLLAPETDQRTEILSYLLDSYSKEVRECGQTIKLADLAQRMEGYATCDVKNLFERALTEGSIRRAYSKKKEILSNLDFEKALETYKPISLVKAKTQESTFSWDDIGGMHEAKKILLETLQWPTLYPSIFAYSPIRIRSGILLYGYPGTGKTILAQSVAKKCGLNFISVKGPELLNKYIGASEQSVRNLFERAKACKPCCLFLDEFDSIAPRRIC